MKDPRLTKAEIMRSTREDLIEFATQWCYAMIECQEQAEIDAMTLEDIHFEFLEIQPILDDRMNAANHERELWEGVTP